MVVRLCLERKTVLAMCQESRCLCGVQIRSFPILVRLMREESEIEEGIAKEGGENELTSLA